MGTISVTPDNYGMNVVRNVGYQLRTLIGTFDFDDTYASGGEDFDLSNYFAKEITGVAFFPQDGYVFQYDEDNKKVKVYQTAAVDELDMVNQAAGQTLTVTDTDSPGGNAVYLKYTTAGEPYLCCNMANDTADKIIDFGNGIKVRIVHDGSASGGTQVYFDEDGDQPDRLLADLTTVSDNVYIKSTVPGYYLKIKNDGSASGNGVAINYDDDTDEQLEATTDGDADADLDLATNKAAAASLTEVSAGTNLSSVTGVRFYALGR